MGRGGRFGEVPEGDRRRSATPAEPEIRLSGAAWEQIGKVIDLDCHNGPGPEAV